MRIRRIEDQEKNEIRKKMGSEKNEIQAHLEDVLKSG